MSALAEVRKEIKDAREHREDLLGHEANVEDRIGELLKEKERTEKRIKRMSQRRHELRAELEAEVEADQQGEGERTEAWEERKRERREELADLRENEEAYLDRIVQKLHDKRKEDDRVDAALEQNKKRIKRLVARRKRIKEDTAGGLTKDFHVAEFDCRDGTPVPEGIIPELRALCEQHLQPLRDSGGSVHINSGYRTPSYNASVGGATQSYHIYSLRMTAPAADHIQTGRSAPAVQQWHDAHNPPDGMGYYAGFTHIDARGYRSRWYGAA